jgi:hypothetical protein
MFSPEVDYLVLQEQHKDYFSDIDNQRLIQEARLQPSVSLKSRWEIINWLGTQLIIWGSRLQRFSATPISTITISKMR